MRKVHVYAQLLPFFLMLKFHILGDIFDIKTQLRKRPGIFTDTGKNVCSGSIPTAMQVPIASLSLP